MATYAILGFVLKRTDFGEADRLVTLFTQYKGKINAIAKGVRKMESRKGGNIELFNLVRMQLAEGKSLDIITEADVAESFRNIRENLHLVSLVYQISEIVDQFTLEGQSSSTTYQLYKNTMERLNQNPSENDARKTVVYFEINYLSAVGFKPELNQCVKCGNRLTDGGNMFSPSLGGVVDQDCRQFIASGMDISVETIKTLRFFEIEDWEKASKLKTGGAVLDEAEKTLHVYLEFILEKKLKAVEFAQKAKNL